MTSRIVITGAPGSGKTEFLNRLRTYPELNGFAFFDELARQLLAEHPTFRSQRREFHKEIYRRQIAREDAVRGKSFVTDRGTVDAFAFHPETAQDVGTTIASEYQRYDLVIQLGSAAALGSPYYVQDEIRNESIEDALIIESALRAVWTPHHNYIFVAAQLDCEAKFALCLAAVRRQIGGNAGGPANTKLRKMVFTL
ncbi:MAG TPA: ATP-binding protein [Candidatus Acidoferrum sp.]|nr:ATP-binding protein [Candidatus Acidoferrum sp.]